MRGNTSGYGITLRAEHVEYRGTIGIVERYHAPLSSEFKKMKSDIGTDTSDPE